MFSFIFITHSLSAVVLNGTTLTISGEEETFSPQEIVDADPDKVTETVSIQGNYTEIPDNAFTNYTHIRTVQITAPIITINSYAFSECSSLVTIDLPSTLNTIREYAFYNSAIKILNSNVQEIRQYCFANSALEEVRLNSISTIYRNAFENCYNLKIVEFPSVRYIYAAAFMNCTSLESLDLRNAKRIGIQCFYGCSNLKNVQLSTNIESIPSYSFAYTILESFTVPDGVSLINTGSFEGCSKLISVELPQSIRFIGQYAFKGTAITTFKLPEKITHIYQGTFENCFSLKNFVIYTEMDEIEAYAFSGCMSLEEFFIIGSVSRINSTAFKGCTNLKNFYFCADTVYDENMTLFESNVTVYVQYSYDKDTFFGVKVIVDKSGTCPAQFDPGKDGGLTVSQRNWIIVGAVLTAVILSIVVTLIAIKLHQKRKRRFDSIAETILLGNV